mmetsp:Transcript_20799/g.45369  ORF Transcript_20799/g.45369 Transcript_20799/m.45369 type:complete len:165 (+) Transcript_20799:815-1309(+)
MHAPLPLLQLALAVVELDHGEVIQGQRRVVQNSGDHELHEEALRAAAGLVAERVVEGTPLGLEEVVEEPGHANADVDYRQAEDDLLLHLGAVGPVPHDLANDHQGAERGTEGDAFRHNQQHHLLGMGEVLHGRADRTCNEFSRSDSILPSGRERLKSRGFFRWT